jgi:hypothetical protein
MIELEIPVRAYVEGYLGSNERDVISRAAPIIVAAELRRLAEAGNFGGGELRKRADELDPPAVDL